MKARRDQRRAKMTQTQMASRFSIMTQTSTVRGRGQIALHEKRWGRWQYDARYDVIEDAVGWGYWLPVNDGQTIAHWYAHLSEKRWLSSGDLHDVERALTETRGHGD